MILIFHVLPVKLTVCKVCRTDGFYQFFFQLIRAVCRTIDTPRIASDGKHHESRFAEFEESLYDCRVNLAICK